MIPRGIRNHNPGNLVTGIKWNGLASWDEMTTDQKLENRFCVFRLPVWGTRAIAKVLKTYYHTRGLVTVQAMLARYAPAFENDTNSYTQMVADSLGVAPDQVIPQLDFTTVQALMTAIIQYENGCQPYTWEIMAGIIMAGLEPQAQAGQTAIVYTGD